MTGKVAHKREFFRIDTFIPLKINVVPSNEMGNLHARMADFHDLKPSIVNISGGGLSFKSAASYNKGDILEIIFTIPFIEKTVCVYGEVLGTKVTMNNHYRIFIKFVVITEKIREMIVSFIFRLEREMIMHTQLNQNARLIHIPLSKFSEGTFLPFEIFIRDDSGIKYLFQAGLPYDSFAKEFFQERDISRIYIKKDDLPLFDEYIEKTKVRIKPFDKEDLLSFRDYSFKKRQLHHIDRNLLIPRKEINFSLYSMNDFNLNQVLEITPELPVVIDENIKNIQGDFLIKKADIHLYCGYLLALSESNNLSIKNLDTLVMRENARIAMNDLLSETGSEEKLKAAIAIAGKIIDCISENTDSFYPLLSSNIGDFYNYIHSVNIAVMSIGVGIALNFKRGNLEKLAIGALLHDIGHNAINDEIINKQGKLNKTEYEVFKTHVLEGVRILREHKDIPEESLQAILHHHEKLNGKGYPYGLSGNEISLFGKIIAIADAYDLLTTKRPYRDAHASFDALSILARDASHYDPVVLRTFIKLLAKAT